jgi:urate oxidase
MLRQNAYGKSGIRLVKVTRRGDRHDLIDLTVAIRFEGDWPRSYTDGDNSAVLPTDTMKNTVYALAADAPLDEPEPFGLRLAQHFLERNERLQIVTIDIVQHLWGRVMSSTWREDGQSFVHRGPDVRTATIVRDRGKPSAEIRAGIRDLLILKSSRSAFAGFPRDEYTTLPETHDRILATSLTTSWRYAHEVPFGGTWAAIRQTLLDTFAAHDSASVQHTLYAMGRAVIDTIREVESIHLVMPNKHHLPVDLSRFGLPNRNEIFVATDEPFGLIEATVDRAS